MSELEAIKYVLKGGHPGNAWDNAPNFGLSTKQEILDSIPNDWKLFWNLIKLWLDANPWGFKFPKNVL